MESQFDTTTALAVQGVSKYFSSGSTRPAWLTFGRSKNGTNGKNNDQKSGANGQQPPATGHTNGAGRKRVMAVDNVSFEVARGEIFGVLGPNGSGKSTLIRCISTLLVPDDGRIIIFGLDAQKQEMAVKRLINRVSVEAAFFKKLSPMENLLYAARLYGVSAGEARTEAKRILTRLDIRESSLNQPLEEMSRGMQQKVAIARALLTSPILLLLDEPTTGLDPRSKREVQTFVQELQAEQDATILLTTHDMHEAEALCSRIAVLDDGKVVALGTLAELKTRVKGTDGLPPTLEDVFMGLTGKKLETEEDLAQAA
jgi:ABC-2 type transport system ATP-binding protein